MPVTRIRCGSTRRSCRTDRVEKRCLIFGDIPPITIRSIAKRITKPKLTVSQTPLTVRPDAHSVFELSAGTGCQRQMLAAKGFDVCVIERSAEMVAIAKASSRPIAKGNGRFVCR